MNTQLINNKLKRNNNNDNNFSNSSIIHEQNTKGTAVYRVVVMTHELNHCLEFLFTVEMRKKCPTSSHFSGLL